MKTHCVTVIDGSIAIARHPELEKSVAQELAKSYRAMGWQKVTIARDGRRDPDLEVALDETSELNAYLASR